MNDTVTRTQAAALAGPSFAHAGHEIAMAMLLPAFLSTQAALPLTVTAVLLLALKTWDTLNDPLMASLSDATASRWGRRKLWIGLGTPLILISTAAVYFLPGSVASTPAGTVSLIAGLFGLTLGWTMVNVPHGVWALETGNTPQERARIFGWRAAAAKLAAPAFIAGPALLERLGHADISLHMAAMGALICLSLPPTVWYLLRTVPDRPGSGRLDWRALWHGYGGALRKPESRPLAGLFALAGANIAINATLYVFLMRYTFALGDWSARFLLLQTLAGIAGIGLWLWLHRHKGTRVTLIWLLWLQLCLGAALLILPAGAPGPFALYAAAQGIAGGVSIMLLRVWLAGTIPDRETSGSHYAAFHLLFNLVWGAATFLVLTFLARMGFEPRQADAAQHGDLLRYTAVCTQIALSGLMLMICARFKMRP